MNSGIPLENFSLVPWGHQHHHQDHLAFTWARRKFGAWREKAESECGQTRGK
jgi:hypothetical protein